MSVRTLSQQKLSSYRYNTAGISNVGYGSVTFASGDYLSIANNAAFKYDAPSGNANDYTIEYWCYPTTTSTAGVAGINYSGGYWAFFHNYQVSSGVEFFEGDNYQVSGGSNTLTVNAWNHVAASRNGTTTRLFVNGVQKGSQTASYAANSTSSMYIGKEPVLNRPFIGKLSNLRIVKGSALYTANFTPPNSPLTAIAGTTLLTCNDPTTIKDYSSNALTVSIAAGSPTASSTSPF